MMSNKRRNRERIVEDCRLTRKNADYIIKKYSRKNIVEKGKKGEAKGTICDESYLKISEGAYSEGEPEMAFMSVGEIEHPGLHCNG